MAINVDPAKAKGEAKTVTISETGNGKWENIASASGHELVGDQPKPIGKDAGPGPYDYMAMALGLCTNQTLRMYADKKRLPVTRISSTIRYDKIHVEDCEDCAADKTGKALAFFREIEIEGELEAGVRERMLEIADMCPVHKALEGTTQIKSSLIG